MQQTQLERPQAAPGKDGLAIPPSAVLPLVLPLPRRLRCWIWGFSLENWKGLPGLFGCGVFFSPPLLLFLELGELSVLQVLPGFVPKLASLGQLKAVFNLHSFGEGTPSPGAAFALEVLGSNAGFDGLTKLGTFGKITVPDHLHP